MEFMTLAEVADLLRVNPKTVYRLVSKRRIPATMVGSQWRFDKSAIEGWLKSKSNKLMSQNIMVVDDDEAIRMLFKDTLGENGYRVRLCATAAEAIKMANEENFDMAFIDLLMPVMDGAELIRQIKNDQPDITVTVITGYPESEVMNRALAYGPFSVMQKPFTTVDILNAVKVLSF